MVKRLPTPDKPYLCLYEIEGLGEAHLISVWPDEIEFTCSRKDSAGVEYAWTKTRYHRESHRILYEHYSTKWQGPIPKIHQYLHRIKDLASKDGY